MTETSLRSVTMRRTAPRHYVATNVRGGELVFGEGAEGEFTPVELLLTAIAGCTAMDVDFITSRRSEPTAFEVTASAHKLRDESGNRLDDIELVFRVSFPAGSDGDPAREVLPDAVAKSHDRLCTVTRTVELGTRVAVRVESAD